MKWVRLLALLISLFVALPSAVVVVMSFGQEGSFRFPPRSFGFDLYGSYFNSGPWLNATTNSFVIGLSTMVLTMIVAVPVAAAQTRFRYRGHGIVEIMLLAPIVIPPVVTALAYFGFLSRFGLNGSIIGMVIAHTALSLPVSYLVLGASMRGFDLSLERAAASSGANLMQTLWHVTFPVLRPGLLVAALFAFLQSFNESVVSIFLAGRQAETLPKRMFTSISGDTDPVIAAVSGLMIGAIALGAVIWIVVQRIRDRSGRKPLVVGGLG